MNDFAVYPALFQNLSLIFIFHMYPLLSFMLAFSPVFLHIKRRFLHPSYLSLIAFTLPSVLSRPFIPSCLCLSRSLALSLSFASIFPSYPWYIYKITLKTKKKTNKHKQQKPRPASAVSAHSDRICAISANSPDHSHRHHSR